MSIKNKDIKLNDGTLKIIINAYEKYENKKLRELLKYMKDGTITNDLTRRIDDMVTKVRNDNVALKEYKFVSATIMDAIGEGKEAGIREGRIEESFNTARRMKKANCEDSFIMEMTGLTQKEVEAL